MPTQRKRIGFLPRADVQTIIDQICKDNKLSQSKVTSILVEEALTYRGVLNSLYDFKSLVIESNNNKLSSIDDSNINNVGPKDKNYLNLNGDGKKDEVQMINDFIEYKFFKKIINKIKNKDNNI